MLPVAQLGQVEEGLFIDKRIAREAALWSVKLHPSARPSAQTISECEQWRAKDVVHELAWRRAQDFNAKFDVISPSLGQSTLNRPTLPERRRAIKTVAIAIATAPVGWYVFKNGMVETMTADYRTATGERRSVQLADGSQIELNTDSAVEVLYDSKQRLVILRKGEAYIQTAKDTESQRRPFLVKTEHGLLRALGTSFGVRVQDGFTSLSVFQHAVEVTIPLKSSQPVIVNAGEQLSFTQQEIQRPVTLDQHTADWRNGLLYAYKTPLHSFTNELARYRRGWIKCHPALANMQVSGSFQLDDTDHVLQALVATLPIKVTFYTRYWVSIEPIES